MAVITLPNKSYWAIFDVRNASKVFIPAMFILKSDAEKWAKEQHYTEEEIIYKKVYALVNVVEGS